MATEKTLSIGEEKAKRGRALCHHHWVIESANGPVSVGVCRLCGARREFFNYLSDCVQATEDEYDAWVSRQRDYSTARRSRGEILVGV